MAPDEARVTFGRALGRALRLRCPGCGQTPMFRGIFSMHPSCSSCGLNFQREQGYYVGAMYLNYGVTAAIELTAGLLLVDRVPLRVLSWPLAGFAILFPLLFFRHSRSLWLGLELYVVSRIRS
jgi:uncharacterized protein (DUF983 family)